MEQDTEKKCKSCEHDCHCGTLVCVECQCGVAIVQKNLNAQIGVNMWFFLISSIASSIIGSAADSWFADTKLGRWFYKKVDDVASWASKKLGLKDLQNEDNWRKKYPNVAKKIDNLEARILELEKEK